MSEVVELNDGSPRPSRTFCMTPTARQIFAHCDEMRQTQRIGLIIGNPGVGKTTVLREYARTHPGVVMASLTTAFATQRTIVDKLLDAFQIQPWATAFLGKYQELCSKLWDGGGPYMLIVDEAQEAEKPALNVLRGLYDDEGLVIVLAGNEEFRNRRYDATLSKYAALGSRLGQKLDLPGSTSNDVKVFCHSRNVTDVSCVAYLTECSKKFGGLRGVEMIIERARILADGERLTVQLLKEAVRFIGG